MDMEKMKGLVSQLESAISEMKSMCEGMENEGSEGESEAPESGISDMVNMRKKAMMNREMRMR